MAFKRKSSQKKKAYESYKGKTAHMPFRTTDKGYFSFKRGVPGHGQSIGKHRTHSMSENKKRLKGWDY